jgi:hypothetical protein
MYMVELTTVLTQALKATFNSNYPSGQFQDLHISPEFPILRENFPAIWVDFEPTADIHTGGISQLLWTPPVDGITHMYQIWQFLGYATFTIMSLSSLERDKLFDEVVKIIAFSQLNPQYFIFRQTIESNPWIATNISFDTVGQRGRQANSGTPWGTDDILYEITASVGCLGEFASDPSTGEFILLENVQFIGDILDVDGNDTGIMKPNVTYPPG